LKTYVGDGFQYSTIAELDVLEKKIVIGLDGIVRNVDVEPSVMMRWMRT